MNDTETSFETVEEYIDYCWVRNVKPDPRMVLRGIVDPIFVSLRDKLVEMELHDDLPDSHDMGFMAAWREIRDWMDDAEREAFASSREES